MHTTTLKVTLDVLISVETDKPYSDLTQDERNLVIVENVAETICMFNDSDLKAAISETEVVRICHKCGADLTKPGSVSRLYVSKNEEYEDASCLGHYDPEHFEPDSKPSYPLVCHDLLDNSDECQSCGASL